MSAWSPTTRPDKGNAHAPAAKPGELLTGQFNRARQAAADKRHEQLVGVIESLADDVRTGLRATDKGNPITAARAKTVITSYNLPIQRIASSNGRLIGWSLTNTDSNFVLVRFRAGRDETGDVIAVTRLDSYATSTMRVGGPGGIYFGDDGLTVQVTGGGLIEGSVHLGEVD